MRIVSAEVRKDTWEQYRAADGLNWSAFKHAVRSSSYARWKRDNPHKGSAIGRLTHAMTLEPGSENAEFVVSPFDSFRTKAAQEWRDAETRQVVTASEWSDSEKARDAVLASPLGSALLTGATTELSVYAEVEVEPNFIVKAKGRIDIANPAGIIADLKTTDALDAGEFVRAEVCKLHYVGQAAFYSELAAAAGLATEGWAWLCVNVKTFDVFGVEADEDALAVGSTLWRKAFARFATAQRDDNWPGSAPNDRCERLVLPAWYVAEHGEGSPVEHEDNDDDADSAFWGE